MKNRLPWIWLSLALVLPFALTGCGLVRNLLAIPTQLLNGMLTMEGEGAVAPEGSMQDRAALLDQRGVYRGKLPLSYETSEEAVASR